MVHMESLSIRFSHITITHRQNGLHFHIDFAIGWEIQIESDEKKNNGFRAGVYSS